MTATPVDAGSFMINTRPHWWRALFWASLCSIAFIVVYGFCNTITHQRFVAGVYIPSLYLEIERRIPLVPLFIIPYMSIDLFFFASFFLCTDLGELRTHAKRILLAITIAGTCFLLFPLRYGFDRPTDVPGVLGFIFAFLHSFDHPYNLAPSLHIAFRSILWVVYIRHTRGVLRWSVRVWLILVGLSTLFVFQHHVVDLLAGQALAMFCFYLFPDAVAPSERNARAGAPQRNLPLAAAFGVGLLVCLMTGPLLRPWGWTLIWPAFAFAMLALAFVGFGPEVFHKTNGRLPLTSRILLAPGLLVVHAWSWFRRSDTPWTEPAPGLLVGRALSDAEARQALDAGVVAVVDLTAEASEPRPLLGVAYLNLPTLPGTRPTPESLARAVDFIAEHIGRGKVYIHSLAGRSRPSAVVAAWSAYCISEGVSPEIGRTRTSTT